MIDDKQFINKDINREKKFFMLCRNTTLAEVRKKCNQIKFLKIR